MRQSINHYLNILKEYEPLTEEQHAVMESRIRREVIARYGRFPVIKQQTASRKFSISTLNSQPSTFNFFRPAFSFAMVTAVVIVAAVIVLAPDFIPDLQKGAAPLPRTSSAFAEAPSQAVANAIPSAVVPGSGFAVSVFGPAPELVSSPNYRSAVKVRRQPQKLNPAAGVFTEWGTTVFSPKEEMRRQAEEISVFSS